MQQHAAPPWRMLISATDPSRDLYAAPDPIARTLTIYNAEGAALATLDETQIDTLQQLLKGYIATSYAASTSRILLRERGVRDGEEPQVFSAAPPYGVRAVEYDSGLAEGELLSHVDSLGGPGGAGITQEEVNAFMVQQYREIAEQFGVPSSSAVDPHVFESGLSEEELVEQLEGGRPLPDDIIEPIPFDFGPLRFRMSDEQRKQMDAKLNRGWPNEAIGTFLPDEDAPVLKSIRDTRAREIFGDTEPRLPCACGATGSCDCDASGIVGPV